MTSPDPDLVRSVHALLVDSAPADTDLHLAARQAVRRLAPLLSPADHEAMVARVLSELAGLGALDELIGDPGVQEIMVNAGRDVWADRDGRIARVGQLPDGAVDVLLERILAPLGRRLDRHSPMVDARLPDGSRVCAVIPPAAPDGATFTIRRFGVRRLGIDAFGAPGIVDLLQSIVSSRCNVVVSGATSSGKTTLLNALAATVPAHERLITLEDTLELSLQHDHVVRLETRSATADGVPAIGLDALLRTALRLRPDRLVVGEVRGPEAVVLIQAMGTGHDGSLATVHANDSVDALRRLEVLIMQGAPSWPLASVRSHLCSSIDVVVHVARTADGRRRITEIAELTSPTASGDIGTRLLAEDDRVVQTLGRHRTSTPT